jgi:hypothetical protein
MLGIKPRASHMLGKRFTTELYPQLMIIMMIIIIIIIISSVLHAASRLCILP